MDKTGWNWLVLLLLAVLVLAICCALFMVPLRKWFDHTTLG
jgi:hypothetical protein